MMFNVVDKKWGTGYSIKDSMLTMAGKTGTCQVDYTTDEVQYISSFVGYYPVEEPKYSCIVVIHKPNKTKGYYGATVAAPVFKTIAKKIFNDIPYEVKINSTDLAVLDQEKKVQEDEKVMPNLAGLSKKLALEILERKGFKVLVKGTGLVRTQSPKAGTPIQKQQKIILELS